MSRDRGHPLIFVVGIGFGVDFFPQKHVIQAVHGDTEGGKIVILVAEVVLAVRLNQPLGGVFAVVALLGRVEL